MNTGLITFHFAHHYGAQLQAYATMRAVEELGHRCEVIDFRLPHTTRSSALFQKPESLRALAANAHTALHYRDMKQRFDRFEAFVSGQMHLSRRYTSDEELRRDVPDYDVYLAGSDQIWNPYIYADKQFEPAFLLDFARGRRKIAYAPSLGVSSLIAPYDGQLRDYLADFSALSARESRGKELLERITDREVALVLDPTLLLDGRQWGELAAPPERREPYILCYFISDPGEVGQRALEMHQCTGWPIVHLAGIRRALPGTAEVVYSAGPREFLGLFQNAACVCTNSFHGSVFSLQFDRPFFTAMSPKEKAEPSYSRIYSLLDRLGCADRILGLPHSAAADAKINYDAVHQRLAQARAESSAYLKHAIEGAD